MVANMDSARRNCDGKEEAGPGFDTVLGQHNGRTGRSEGVTTRKAARCGGSDDDVPWPLPQLLHRSLSGHRCLDRLIDEQGRESGDRQGSHGAPTSWPRPHTLSGSNCHPHNAVVRQVGEHGRCGIYQIMVTQWFEEELDRRIKAR